MAMDEPQPAETRPPEKTLAAGDAPFRSLLEQVPAVVYVDTNELRSHTLYVSPQCEEVFGRPGYAYIADPDLWERSVHADDLERVHEEWRTAFARQDRFETEYRAIRADGSEIWVRDASVLVRDDDGSARYWQGVVHDITSFKRAEEALRESEARYRLLVEHVPAVVYMVAPDDDRRTLYVSQQVERALGYSRREWLDQPDIWMELLHPDDRETTLAAHDRHNESGEPWSREYRLIASDGRAVWFRDVATLQRDEGGRAQHWLGVQLDITELKGVEDHLRSARDELEHRVRERTAELEEANELMALEIAERRRAEEDLRTTELRYRLLAENIPAVTYIRRSDSAPPFTVDDESERRDYMSPRIEQLLGFTPAAWLASADFWISRLHPDDRTAVLAGILRSETTGEAFSMEYRYLAKDGRVVWVLDQAVPLSLTADGRPDLFQGVMIDITARKEAEARAIENEQRFRTLAEQAPAITYLVDLTKPGWLADVTYVSPQITSMLGYSQAEWSTSGGWLATVHPDDRDRIAALVAKQHGGDAPYEMEYRLLHRDGTVRWVRDVGNVLSRDALGRPAEIQGLIVDVTASRHAEDERRAAEARYRTLVEQIPAVTFVEVPSEDPAEVHLTYISPQAEAFFGLAPRELIEDPSHFGRLLHPEDRERVFAANARSEATGEPFDEEYRIVRPDGGLRWVRTRARLVRTQGAPPFWHGVITDVTSQREAETSLRDLEERYEELALEVSAEDAARAAAREGTGVAPSGSRPSRRPPGGSRGSR
jgi:PAS domain S-box-containing protein